MHGIKKNSVRFDRRDPLKAGRGINFSYVVGMDGFGPSTPTL